MKAYKGFIKQADGSLKCRDFTYEEGKTYELPESEIELCKIGFYACKGLHQCWSYYPHKDENVVYHEVECDGSIIEIDGSDGKVCCSKITIGKAVDTSKLPVFENCGWFHEGYAAVRERGKWTFIDTEGKFIGDGNLRFDYCCDFKNGYAVVRKGEKWTYIDARGEYLIKDEGKRWFDGCWNFKNGYAKVEKGEKQMYISTKGNLFNTEEEAQSDSKGNAMAEGRKHNTNGEFVNDDKKTVGNICEQNSKGDDIDEILDKIIIGMIESQRKKLNETNVCSYVPPTQKCFSENMMAMYSKGVKDTINEAKRIIRNEKK